MASPGYWGDMGRSGNAPNPYSIGIDYSRMVDASERVYDTEPGNVRHLSRAEIKAWEREHPAYRTEKPEPRTVQALYMASRLGRGGKFSRALAGPKVKAMRKQETGFKFTAR